MHWLVVCVETVCKYCSSFSDLLAVRAAPPPGSLGSPRLVLHMGMHAAGRGRTGHGSGRGWRLKGGTVQKIPGRVALVLFPCCEGRGGISTLFLFGDFFGHPRLRQRPFQFLLCFLRGPSSKLLLQN